ncbi:hypothetical protein [Halomonas sp. SCS19]|uniref:hypothetical protein n=1 Tax=Halomonas sp. SCS19 TaxID=2950870 RepID=UPI0032DFD282
MLQARKVPVKKVPVKKVPVNKAQARAGGRLLGQGRIMYSLRCVTSRFAVQAGELSLPLSGERQRESVAAQVDGEP